MKIFSWVIGCVSIVMFYNAQGMKSPRLQSLTYIVGEDNKKDIALEIVLRQGIKFFDYIMIRSLAINHHFDEILHRTAEERKQYLQEYIRRFVSYNNAQYQESCMYGAVNGRINIELTDRVMRSKRMTMKRDCLLNPMKQPYSYTENNFYAALPCSQQPFFNVYGDFCFYACGNVPNIYTYQVEGVFEYSLSADGVGKKIECRLLAKDYCYTLKIFLELPFLLEAILNSCQVYKGKINKEGEDIKFFCLKGVMIPKDYASYERYFSVQDSIYFRDLPKELRTKIISMYKRQCAEKKRKKFKL